MKTIQAVKDKVIVEVLKQEESTKGGIIVPETVINEPQLYGKVMSVGEDISTIKPGNILLFHRNGGQDIVEIKIVKNRHGIIGDMKIPIIPKFHRLECNFKEEKYR